MTLSWPRSTVPVLRSGGRFPMVAHNPACVYVVPGAVALHLHNYAGKMWLANDIVRLEPGDFTLTPAQMPSRYDLEQAGMHLCVHFDEVAAGTAAVALPLHWRPGPHERWIRERLQEIIDLHRRAERGGDLAELARDAAGTALQSLLLWIAVSATERREGTGRAVRVDRVLDDVRRHLDEHYRKPLEVPALAKRFGVSQNYLAREFRQRHGTTLQRYMLALRIELARHLIAVTRLPLKAVAIEAGFRNPQYFHRQFRQATGHSPSEERALTSAAPASGA